MEAKNFPKAILSTFWQQSDATLKHLSCLSVPGAVLASIGLSVPGAVLASTGLSVPGAVLASTGLW